MQLLEQLKRWHGSLPTRDMWLVNLTAVFVLLTLFYLAIWEPIHKGLEAEKVKHETGQEVLAWMQQAAQQVQQLRASGGRSQNKSASKPTTLVLEQTLSSAGLRPFVGKIESASKNSARVKLENVPFNQMLVWLNTLTRFHGMTISSATIERGDKPGSANARLSFSRS